MEINNKCISAEAFQSFSSDYCKQTEYIYI